MKKTARWGFVPGNTRAWVFPVRGKVLHFHPGWAVTALEAVRENLRLKQRAISSRQQLSLTLVTAPSKLAPFCSFLEDHRGHGP